LLEVIKISSSLEKFKEKIAASIDEVPLQKEIPYFLPIKEAKSFSNFLTKFG
jgi:hypothetical protein